MNIYITSFYLKLWESKPPWRNT